MSDNTQDQTKLQALFEKAFRGHRIHALPPKGGSRVWNPKKGSTEWIEPARSWMDKQRDCKFYFSPALIKPGRSTTTKDDMRDSLFVWADLDPREGQPLDEERAAILALLTDDLPYDVLPPTFIVDSGRGYWGYWRLKAPHVFDGANGDATRAFEAVLRGLGNAFGEYGDRSVKNINRIARLPGSINPKTGQRAEVVAYNPASYRLDQFPRVVAERKARAVGNAEPIPLDLFKKMLAATPYTGGPKRLDNRRSYDGWLQFMMAAHEAGGGDCADYLAAFTEWSQNDDEYSGENSAESIQAHWESFDSGAAGGVTRGSWIKLLGSFAGNDELLLKLDGDARDEFPDDDVMRAAAAEPVNNKGRTRAINTVKKLRKVTTANKSAEAEVAKAKEDIAKYTARYNLTEADFADNAVSSGSSPEWFDITRQWVYIGQQERFFDLESRELWKTTAFDNYYASIFVMDKDRNAPLSKYIFRNQSLPMYKSVVYEPGLPTEIGGNFNTWLASDIEPVEGDTSMFDAHMAYLFPDEKSRNNVLNYLAWVYCNQNLKPRHWLLVHGERQGTGKSFIAHVLTRLLGRKLPNGLISGTTLIKGNTLDAAHSGWELNTKLIVVEEVRPGFGSSNAVVKGLHDLISEPTLFMDQKNITPTNLRNILAGILFSNKDNAVTVDNSDRRYLIETVDTPQRKLMPKPAAYYDALYDTLKDPALMAAIAYQFTKRDLGGYSGLAAAPMTIAKTTMADETRDDLERWFDEQRTSLPLSHSLVTLEEVLDIIPADIVRKTSNLRKRLADLIRDKLNGENLGKVRLGGRSADQPRMWRINKETSAPTDRRKYPDKLLSYIYRREHGKLTAHEKREKAKREALLVIEARQEFGLAPVAIEREAAGPGTEPVDDLADLM